MGSGALLEVVREAVELTDRTLQVLLSYLVIRRRHPAHRFRRDRVLSFPLHQTLPRVIMVESHMPRKFDTIELLPYEPPYAPALMEELGLRGLHCGSARELAPGWVNTDQRHLEAWDETATAPGRLARIQGDLHYLEFSTRGSRTRSRTPHSTGRTPSTSSSISSSRR